ncbi:unnamed protein product [Diamesa tonsa]
MSDEEDYMSDAFLLKMNDVKPSLIKNNSVKRANENESKKKKLIEEARLRNRPMHVIQKEKLKEGLNKAITSDNKGFAMLQKMGFKAGTSLGKLGTTEAIKEPIKIVMKADQRSGLGVETAAREMQDKLLINFKRKIQDSDMSAEDYRKKMREQSDTKQPENKPMKNDSDENSDDEEVEEPEKPELSDIDKLEMLRKFLRNSYFYCDWCGNQFTNAQDMLDSCPGPTKDDH